MATMTSSRLMSWITANKLRVWRLINSAVILLSYFLPWGVMQYDPVNHHDWINNGFQMLEWYRRLGESVFFWQELSPDKRTRVGTFTLIDFFLGLATILIYCALSATLAAFAPRLASTRVWRATAFGLIAFGLLALWHVAYLRLDDWSQLSAALVGYWSALVALISSSALEVSYYLSERNRSLPEISRQSTEG